MPLKSYVNFQELRCKIFLNLSFSSISLHMGKWQCNTLPTLLLSQSSHFCEDSLDPNIMLINNICCLLQLKILLCVFFYILFNFLICIECETYAWIFKILLMYFRVCYSLCNNYAGKQFEKMFIRIKISIPFHV